MFVDLTWLPASAAVAATVFSSFGLTSSRIALSTLLGIVTVMLMVCPPCARLRRCCVSAVAGVSLRACLCSCCWLYVLMQEHGAQLDTNTYLNQRRGVTGITRRRETVYFVGTMLCALFNFLLILCLGACPPFGGRKVHIVWRAFCYGTEC